MIELQEALNLPLEALAIIAAGYLSYRLAYTGKDKHHRSLDVFFVTAVFASLAQISASLIVATAFTDTGTADTVAERAINQITSIAGGLIVALLAAAVWRKWGIELTRNLLRKTRVSNADTYVSAWETLIGREVAKPSSLHIVKTNGDQVMCERLADFASDEFGPCIYGHDGSVALFVTHRKNATANDWESFDPRYEDWGPEITFIPASEIAEIRIRHGA